MKPVGVGVIGCGNISSAYLTAAKKFPILDIVALSDANPAAAEARAAEFGVPARSVDALLADPAVEVILNLTVPKAHVEVGLKAIAAGKHVHSEKPLGVSCRRGAPARRSRGGEGPAGRLRARHLSRRRTSDRAPMRRRGADRPADRRHGVLHVPGARALASQSRLLLPRRRRPDARHGALLCHRPRQSAWAGRERQRRRHAHEGRARRDEQAARRNAHSRRGRNPRHGNRFCSPAARRCR